MGVPHPSSWSIRELSTANPDFLAAMHLAVMARLSDSNSISQPVQDLFDCESAGTLCLRPLVGSYQHNILRFSVLGVESLGGSNLLLVPFELETPLELDGGLLALRRVLELSGNFGVSLSQIIGPEHESKWDVVLRQAGFIRLTDLDYMTRSISNCDPLNHEFRQSVDHRWITYSADSEGFFCEAIGRSYVDSMDCPELTNVRTVQQTLTSHRAVGLFDPDTWFVLANGNQPLGVLLLNRLRRERAMEIVYMGVSQAVRGSGVGDLLMGQALRTTAENAVNLILAVDARNVPAIRLYSRWGLVRIARRSAWIANVGGIER